MASLLDIAPPKARQFELPDGQQLDIVGLSALSIARLMERFPEDMRKFMSGTGNAFPKNLDELRADPEAMTTAIRGLTVIAALIAAGCGYLDNPQAEGKAGSLPLDVQANLLGAIMDASGTKRGSQAAPLLSGSLVNGSASVEAGREQATN